MAIKSISRTAVVVASVCTLLAAIPAIAQQGNRPASAPAPDVTPIMTRLDTNHDGIVTAAEMRAGGLAPTRR